MKRILLALLLLATPAAAQEMKPVTIQSEVATACSVTFTNPMLAIAWARTVAGELPPESYMQLFEALNPGDPDAWVNARHIIDVCMGQGT